MTIRDLKKRLAAMPSGGTLAAGVREEHDDVLRESSRLGPPELMKVELSDCIGAVDGEPSRTGIVEIT